MIYELSCQYDTRQSFYGKAMVKEQGNKKCRTIDLYSYGTLVASIVCDYELNKNIYLYEGKYSQTTTKHQKEFFRQYGLTEKEIKELWKNGKLEKQLF